MKTMVIISSIIGVRGVILSLLNVCWKSKMCLAEVMKNLKSVLLEKYIQRITR